MELMKRKTHINFMGHRRFAMFFSIALVLVSFGSLMTKGLNLGIDFTGGTLVEVGYENVVVIQDVRERLAKSGFDDVIVQHFGTAKDVLIRLASSDSASSDEVSNHILDALSDDETNRVSLRRVEFVGPQIGKELTEDGGIAMLIALGAIFIYVGFIRYEKRFALGSVAALIHDVVITLGFFSLFQVDFDLSVLAALLAVIGYSLNDTIVVFDRIRENFRKIRKGLPLEVCNTSINQTISRTLITSLTTLLVLIALFILGGEVIHGFSIALIVGVIIGTYSSIYVASSVALALGVSKEDLMPVEKEGQEIDDMP